MSKIRQVADTPVAHPTSLEEIGRVPQYYCYKWEGKRYRVLPLSAVSANNTYFKPCRSCMLEMQRIANNRCPGMDICCAHMREDATSVKFISDKLSVLNGNWEAKAMAAKADLKQMNAKCENE